MKSFDGLTELPALIDSHVHFRTPGAQHKEDWIHGARAALHGGVTTVLDMPNNTPPCNTYQALCDKKNIINEQLEKGKIFIRHGLYFGASKNNLDEIRKAHRECVALKVFMSGCQELSIDSEEILEKIFCEAASLDMVLALHAEDESIVAQQKRKFAGYADPSTHSLIRAREAATSATKRVIGLSRAYNVTLYLCHISSRDEVELVRQAKKEGIKVYAEVSPHHLFFNHEAYERLGTFIQVNPPVRTKDDQDALLDGVNDGTIDTIATDHAPHTYSEKKKKFGEAPSGVPGIEMLLPLLLTAVHDGKMTLDRVIEMTHFAPQKIFKLAPNDDAVLVDLNYEREVEEDCIVSKCGWTPYLGMRLRGWPEYVILDGNIHSVSRRKLGKKE